MHGMRMRARCFKSTPTRRPYQLPSKKSQVNIFESSPISVHDEHISDCAAEDVETTLADVLVTTAHFDESFSFEDIFIPTPGHPSATNEGVGDSTSNLGENIADPTNENPDANADAHGEPIDNYALDNVEPNVDVPQRKTQQPLGESRPKEKKFQQNRRNITIKTGRKKVLPNIPSVPINGISFHLDERLSKTISNVGPFYPQLTKEFIANLSSFFNNPSSPDYQTVYIRVLASVLSGGTLSIWLVNGISIVSLSVKYVILHKIDIANRFPSSHASSVSVALGTFLYQICNDETMDAGLFIYNQLLRHVGTFGVKIPIPFPLFFSSLLIHLNAKVLTPTDAHCP
ncbi:uncharacterized protein E5676_scaffold184G00580 [Cucumis melo var. makuwa]|uniref:Putative plant transposon protein domain-containing protein n=1 Tax=Cucumis melo var. makuwa TaxID=1194695 RepID=A0A5D3DNF9_CUCMM|nr:uncharacterized protein E6C27_scaffold108G001400 [Cucumis melo var. makuwa]TYK24810.1 uncharacterized protein E5676_scaffold184G00580 [Cucumis melo var. makuwa]